MCLFFLDQENVNKGLFFCFYSNDIFFLFIRYECIVNSNSHIFLTDPFNVFEKKVILYYIAVIKNN